MSCTYTRPIHKGFGSTLFVCLNARAPAFYKRVRWSTFARGWSSNRQSDNNGEWTLTSRFKVWGGKEGREIFLGVFSFACDFPRIWRNDRKTDRAAVMGQGSCSSSWDNDMKEKKAKLEGEWVCRLGSHDDSSRGGDRWLSLEGTGEEKEGREHGFYAEGNGLKGFRRGFDGGD